MVVNHPRRSLRTFVKFMHQNELSPGKFLLKARKETIESKENLQKKRHILQTSYEISSQQKGHFFTVSPPNIRP